MNTFKVKFVPKILKNEEQVVLSFLAVKEQCLENPIKLEYMKRNLFYYYKNEKMEFPGRNYYNEITDLEYSLFSDTQKIILNCIMSLNHNGYVREKYVKMLLKSSIGFEPFFIFNQVQSYVIEILNIIYENEKNNSLRYEEFVKQNLELVKTGYRRMVSYWDSYYRSNYPNIKNYVGYKIFTEIFKITKESVYSKR